MLYEHGIYGGVLLLQFLMLYEHRDCVRSGSVTILIGLRPISNVFRLLISVTILYALRAWDLWGSSAVTILDALRAWELCGSSAVTILDALRAWELCGSSAVTILDALRASDIRQ